MIFLNLNMGRTKKYYLIHIMINDFSKHIIIDQHVTIFIINMVMPVIL